MVAPMTGTWAFDRAACKATASSSGPVLELSASRSGAVIALRYRAGPAPRGAAPLRLSGPAGSWSLPGRAVKGAVRIARPLDEDAASRMLLLLGGGTVNAGTGPALVVPPAGDAGRDWFECVRGHLQS